MTILTVVLWIIHWLKYYITYFLSTQVFYKKYFKEKINSPVGNTKLYHKLNWHLPDILTKDHKLHWYLPDILTKGDRVPHEYLENLVNDLTNYGFQITMDSGGISIKENELPNLMQYLGTSKYMDLIISDTIFEKVSDNTPVSVARYRVILFFSFCFPLL